MPHQNFRVVHDPIDLSFQFDLLRLPNSHQYVQILVNIQEMYEQVISKTSIVMIYVEQKHVRLIFSSSTGAGRGREAALSHTSSVFKSSSSSKVSLNVIQTGW